MPRPSSAYLDQLAADYARELNALRARLAEKEAALAVALAAIHGPDGAAADARASELSLEIDDLRDAIALCEDRDVGADASDAWDQQRADWREAMRAEPAADRRAA